MAKRYSLINIALLSLGVILSSIPGFLIVPYGINYFDEPYQIINAIDWENAVYSPLSSWLSYYFGELTEWKWIYFRYLALGLNVLTVYIVSLYALSFTKNCKLVIVSAIVAIYFGTCFKGDQILFGWDRWTFLFTALSLVALCRFFSKPNFIRLCLLGLVSGTLILMRLPNIGILLIVSFLIVFKNYNEISRKTKFFYVICYYIVTIVTVIFFVVVLFLNFSNYYSTLMINPIGQHGLFILSKAFFWRLIECLAYAMAIFICYYFFHFIFSKNLNNVIYIVGIVLTGLSIFFLFYLYKDNVDSYLAIMAAIALLGLMFGLKEYWPDLRKGGGLVVLSIILMGCIPAIGSNVGFFKFMGWFFLPLIVAVCNRFFSVTIKRFALIFIFVFMGWSIYAQVNVSDFDKGISRLDYQFSNGIAKGLRTTQERGENIDKIIKKIEPWKASGYQIIVVRNSPQFIWEYLLLNPNKVGRHNFEWDLLNDSIYINSVQDCLVQLGNRVVVVYLENPDYATKMYDILSDKLRALEYKEPILTLFVPDSSFNANIPSFDLR